MDLLRRLNNLRGFDPRDLPGRADLRLFYQVAPYTHVRWKRLTNVYALARDVEARGLTGAFVEAGVARGGCAGVMAAVARDAGGRRLTWLFDSFQGLPEPGPEDGELARRYAAGRLGGRLETIGRCVGPIEVVRELLFERLGLDEQAVRLVPGWFQDTLPARRAEVGPITLLRLDGDWYASTKVCLEQLYDQVVPGGWVILDDYGHWEGCRRATEEFLAARGLDVSLERIDYTGRYFRKP